MVGEDTQLAVEKWVDRHEQVDNFNETLRQIKRGRPVSTPLFEWYGGPGIGKSTLVRLLSQECEEKRIPWTRTDFKESEKRTAQYFDDPVTLIEDMAADLSQKTELDVTSLYKKIKEYRANPHPSSVIQSYFELTPDERLYQRPDWIESLRSVTTEFIHLVDEMGKNSQGRSRPLVLFFDETEYAPVALIDWIEEWVINPLIQKKHCLVVWTARRPWRWKRPEIRRRVQSEQLRVFEPDEVKLQLQLFSSTPSLAELFFKDVHVVTGGHPFANDVVITQLNTWEAQGQGLSPENFSEHEIELLNKIFNEFIREYALARLGADEKVALELLAMVRLFDTTLLREILMTHDAEEYSEWDQEDFGELLLRLKKTQLLVWGKGGYTLDPDLRYIIRNYFSVCDLPTFVQVNQAALRVYQNWLSRPIENRSQYIIEELYHYAALAQAGEQVDLENELEKRLQEYPTWIQDSQALHNAIERLEGELQHDPELELITAGISRTRLVEQTRKFRVSLPTVES